MEFKEIAKQYNRMCADHSSCGSCPLYNNGLSIKTDCLSLWYTKTDWFESIVSKWTEEHPEPRYPTWYEWMKITFPERKTDHILCPMCFDKNFVCSKNCTHCETQPIPEHLAIKLGVQKIVPAINTDKNIIDELVANLTKIDLPVEFNDTNITMEVNNDSCDCLR